MKSFVPTLVFVAVLSTGAALAGAHVNDADGDGAFSMDEMKATFPDITDEVFAQVDADGDGMVSAEELAAAEDAGTLTQG